MFGDRSLVVESGSRLAVNWRPKKSWKILADIVSFELQIKALSLSSCESVAWLAQDEASRRNPFRAWWIEESGLTVTLVLNKFSTLESTCSFGGFGFSGCVSIGYYTCKNLQGFSNLGTLTYLNLSNAMFKDSITAQLSKAPSLLPSWNSIFRVLRSLETTHLLTILCHGLKNLRKLKLSGVNLSEVSQSTLWAKPISNLTNQRFLDLSNCRISGEIPVEIPEIEKVRALDLSANNFTGSIPAEVGQGNIRYLALSDNEPSGRIPFSLCQEKREGRCKRKGGSGMELNDAVLINESCGTPHVIAGHVGIEMDQGNNDKKGPGNQSKNIADDSKLLP
ncbi:hypothetical protein V6N12_061907 [Hibiscus sabdariffa]|uniref:Uncharacterized protein n=1 Tax=Hibiscus sabdariffa TaxID=183260 RepID=A0ABR2E028_9ROSI